MPAINARRAVGGTGVHLDTQLVTTGADGTVIDQNRTRGFIQGLIGTISDGTSDVYSGAVITDLYWDENLGTPQYWLAITGATASGWATITIGSKTLYRTAATFTGSAWNWSTTDTAGTQAFGTAGSSKTVYFD